MTEDTNIQADIRLQAELTAAVWLDGRVEQQMRANPSRAVADLIEKFDLEASGRTGALGDVEALPAPVQTVPPNEGHEQFTVDSGAGLCRTWAQFIVATSHVICPIFGPTAAAFSTVPAGSPAV